MSPILALDFGTGHTRVADEGAVVLDEPTVAALDADSGHLVAFGSEALSLGASGGGRLMLRRPVRAGQLVDIVLAEEFLAAVLRRAGISRLAAPRLAVCAHLGTTGVQRRAVERALRRAGARSVSFVEQPIADAIGAGLAIEEPVGSMVLDFGAGVCDVAVLAVGGIVAQAALALGADDFDSALREYLARDHRLLVDRAQLTALRHEQLSLAAAASRATLTGRDTRSSAPRQESFDLEELDAVLEQVARPILEAAARCIAEAPPDLANDLLRGGLLLAGGGGRIAGFERRLARATGIPIHIPPAAELLAVRGALRCATEAPSGLPLSAPRPR